MEKIKIYLDNCCFNRSFDDQTQLKIKLETDAKIFIQNKMLSGEYDFVWSYILEFENNRNPYFDKRKTIAEWKHLATAHCVANEQIIAYAESLHKLGIKAKDALHISCAVYTECDCFITTDKKILNTPLEDILTINPVSFITELEEFL